MNTPSDVIRVLVADDSGTVRTFLHRALETCADDIDIITVTNGRDALDELRTTPYDIAFLDIHMPELTGVEVTGAAHALHMKTLAVSMSDELTAENDKLLRSFGAYDFLPKPFTANEVWRIIETYRVIRSPLNLLIVDDSATVRGIVKKVVGRSIFNLNIAEAGDGLAALAATRKTQFQIIFTDFNMPKMTGIQLVSALARFSVGSDVILMSSEYSPELADAAQNVGARAFLHKPFYPEDVDTILHHLFGLKGSRFSKQVKLFATA
jgi:CheY-like chemotaxis protein